MRLVRGGIACALGLGAIMTMASTSGAQEPPPPLELKVDKAVAARGDTVTVSSVDPCTPPQGSFHQVVVTFQVPGGRTEIANVEDLAEDGSWETVWSVLEDTAREPAGEYTVSATCGDNPDTRQAYGPTTFTVVDHSEPTSGLTMAIAPEGPVGPASAMTLASITPCPTYGADRVVSWVVAALVVDGDNVSLGPIVDDGFGYLAADGAWFASFVAPHTEGPYAVFAACGRRSFWMGSVSGVLHTDRVWTSFYDGLFLPVGPGAEVPDGPLPTLDAFPDDPAPARPVAGRPGYTG